VLQSIVAEIYGPSEAQRLALARKAKGISQEQFAKLLGTTRTAVDYYERRAANPSKRQKPLRHPPKLVQHAPKPDKLLEHCTPAPEPSPTATQDVRRWTQAQRCVLFGLTTSLVGVEILASARRHGISDRAQGHAVENSLTGGRSDEETGFAMLVGLDQSGNLIEIGIVVTDDIEYAIQAMRARNRYSDWL
jgi:hypothetical protein